MSLMCSKKRTAGALVGMLLIWSFPPVVIKYLSFHFPPMAQNFYRYLAASVFLLPVSFFLFPQHLKKCIKNTKHFIVPSLFLSGWQVFLVYGVSLSKANTAGFLAKMTGVFVVLIGWAALPEEREIIKRGSFIAGFTLAFTGAALIILSKEKLSFSLGSTLLILATFCWALYTVQMKKLLRELQDVDSLSAMSFVSGCTCVFLLILAVPDLGKVTTTPLAPNLLLFLSGFLLVGVAGVLYYFLIQKIGATITNTALLSTSFLTVAHSYLFLGEKMTIQQIIGGCVVVLGCYFVLRGRYKT